MVEIDYSALESVLGGGTEEERYKAVRDLVKSGSIGAVRPLLAAMGDESFRVREESLRGVCGYPAELVFPELEKYLRDGDDANVRTAAMEAFPRYGKRATSYLLALLRDPDEEIRTFSGVMLGAIGDPDSVADLIAALDDVDENVAHAAAEALGMIADDGAVEPLIEALKKEFWIRYPAATALGQIGDPRAVPPLLDLIGDDMLQGAVIEALGNIGDPSAAPALARLLARDDPLTRNDVIAALVKVQSKIDSIGQEGGDGLGEIAGVLGRDDVVRHLTGSLSDPDLEVRKNAVVALGWLKKVQSLPGLIELLGDFEIEEYVAGAITGFGPEAVPQLVAALEMDPEAEIKCALVRCLDWIGDERGLLACLGLLQDPDAEVRLQSVMALGGASSSPAVEDALIGVLADDDPDLRSAAAEALGKSRSASLEEKIRSAMPSLRGEAKAAAVHVLGDLEGDGPFQTLMELASSPDTAIRAEAIRALGKKRSGLLESESLLAAINDGNPLVRAAAAVCLGAAGSPGPVSHLERLIRDKDQSVGAAAAESLARVGGPESAAVLMDRFAEAGPRLRRAIIRSLGSFADKEVKHFLSETLKDPNPEIRTAVLESMAANHEGRAAPGVIVALDDADWGVRVAAIRALSASRDKRHRAALIDRLGEERDNVIKKEIVAALSKMGDRDTATSLLPLLHEEDLRLEVMEAIERLGAPDMETFADYFSKSGGAIKGLMVDVLGRVGDPSFVPFLIRVLEDEFFTVRAKAAHALSLIGDSRAIAHLIRSQKDDPSEEVRKEAARSLKKLGETR